MPIFLYSSDETQRIKLNDYAVDSSTSLQLIGYGYVNESNPSGQILNQNIVDLLQNFSSGTAPSIPMAGQLWFNDSQETLNIYDQQWENILLEVDLSTSNYANDNLETEASILANGYTTTALVNAQNYETVNNLQIYLTAAELVNFNFTSAAELNTSIIALLDNYLTITQLGSLLLTTSVLDTYGYLTVTQLNTLAFVTATQMSLYLTHNQTITFDGDFSGSGTTAIATVLATTGVTSGSYNQVAVDGKGQITSGSHLTMSYIENTLGFSPINPNTQLKASAFSSPSGYQILPSGLILQWITGSIDPADNTSVTQTLPWALTFPTMFIGATVSTNVASASSVAEFWYQITNSQTNVSQVVVQRQNDSSANIISSSPFIIGFGY